MESPRPVSGLRPGFNQNEAAVPHATQPQDDQRLISGDAAVLARRYGGALYELADEQKQMDEVAAELRGLRSLVRDSAEFRYISTQPRLTRPQLITAVQAVAASAGLSKLTTNFLSMVAKNRRLNILSGVIDAFLGELAERRGEFTADVHTARALTSAQEEQLASKLREIAGGKVHLTVKEDKGLIGGITVKLGSRLIDASIKTKLQRLERQLGSDHAA